MNRTIANLVTDLAAAVLFMGMIATGYILHFPLPPGTNRILSLWGLTRHQWGTVHYWISLGLLIVLAVHILLHWSWIVNVIGKRLSLATTAHPPLLRSGIVVFFIVFTAFALFAWAAHSGVRELPEPLHPLTTPDDQALNGSTPPPTVPSVAFWNDVYPLLTGKCLACHGPRKQLGNFRVDRREDFFARTAGGPLIVPGDSATSRLIAIVSGARPDMLMANVHHLPEPEVSLLRRWIDAGAEWPRSPTDGALPGND